jgi:hypothetical protein
MELTGMTLCLKPPLSDADVYYLKTQWGWPQKAQEAQEEGVLHKNQRPAVSPAG